MIKYIFTFMIVVLTSLSAKAQDSSNDNHLMLSVGALYERGLDATIAYEHKTKYHNAWEYFANAYVKYEEDELAGHYTKESFWNSYNTWNVGIAYKPCVSRGRNHHGNARLGLSGGSDTDKFIGGIHVGYEHTYALRGGFCFFFQVREDMMICAKDFFRTGVSLGVKVPL